MKSLLLLIFPVSLWAAEFQRFGGLQLGIGLPLRIGAPDFHNYEAFEPGIRPPRNFFLALGNTFYFRPALFNLDYGLVTLGLPFIRRFTRDEFPFTDAYYSLNLFTFKF